MRTLAEAPAVIVEGSGIRFGSFRGGLPRMDFGPVPQGLFWQFTHRKQWSYVLVSDDRVLAAAAVVSLGWGATSLVFVLDRTTGELLVDRSLMGPSLVAQFEDGGSGARRARFELGRSRIELGDERVEVDLTTDCSRPTHFMVRAGAPIAPPISAVVPVEDGYANATEKRVVAATGEIVAAGRRFVLRDALCGFDHTCGYLARHTAWRWAFALGKTTEGVTVGFNVVEGFVGEAECALWLDGELHPIGEGRFSYELARPEAPWRVTTACGSLDLRFDPSAVHDERKDLVVARSQFVQPLGAFSGLVRIRGSEHRVEGLAGVTEHQDVLW